MERNNYVVLSKDEDDPDYPWKPGKWPERSMPKIREFCKCEDETRKYSRQVAAILTENEYCVKVLKEKTYKSRRQEDMGGRKNGDD